ncbi:hypothetical protein LB518_22290 [Mesorhizobium sp. BR1-1-16]|uniref:hypothetical protein n=1 Tax=Mesorhizobium sp. BR1-1-16 TaxID=2876653 RepID=UPI001CCD8F39|nr:hypothetical protein [Mesorhizobium sp. BR1-1-16]MBZ9939044.1 hypothetical protein [Mesorhizobium sp. BR1-1-16]
MPVIDIIASLAIVAVFGAFMLTLAFATRKSGTTWPQMQPAKAGAARSAPRGNVETA